MYERNKILSVIPARGGSKGIKDKNIIDLCGKPLIAYTIEEAMKSKFIDDVIISTDSRRIAEICTRYGAEIPFIRPVELALDRSKSIDVVLHAIKALKDNGRVYDCIVLLQPTQPLRIVEDIDLAIETFYRHGKKGVVSISKVEDHPILMRTISGNGELQPLLNMSSTCRRQDMPDYYKVNGCVYVNAVDAIDEKTSFNDNPIPCLMPEERSVDIDELKDLRIAKALMRRE